MDAAKLALALRSLASGFGDLADALDTPEPARAPAPSGPVAVPVPAPVAPPAVISAPSPNGSPALPAPTTDGPATLPRIVPIVAAYPAPVRTVRVLDLAGAQRALDTAQPGDHIVFPAGAVLTGTLTVPATARDVTLRTDRVCPVAPGTRATPTSLVGAARLAPSSTLPALRIMPGARGAVVCDLEVRPSGTQGGYSLVSIDEAPIGVPESGGVRFDRVVIRASASARWRRGVLANGGGLAILDAWVAGFFDAASDAQAVLSFAGSGQLDLTNSLLSGNGECVMIGGDAPLVAGRYPQDIRVRRCHLWKGTTGPFAIGTPGYVPTNKNLFEIKAGGRVLVEGCVLEGQPDGDNGQRYAVALKKAPYGDPTQDAHDVALRYNRYLNCGGGYGFVGFEAYASQQVDVAKVVGGLRNISIHDDLWTDRPRGAGVGVTFGLTGADPARALSDVLIRHVTVAPGNSAGGSSQVFKADTTDRASRVQIRDSVIPFEQYGLLGAQTLLRSGDLVMAGNAITDPGAMLVDADGRVAPSLAARIQTTDTAPVGADVDAVLAATAGVRGEVPSFTAGA